MHFVFDFGGVVFNWQPLQLLRTALPRRAADEAAARAAAADVFQGYAAHGDWAAFDRGDIDAAGLAQRIARRTPFGEAEVHTLLRAIPGHLAPIAETVALLRRLKAAGHRLYYLSNMPAPFADHLEHSHAFMAWFDDGVFSSRVRRLKPQPEIFHEAARRFGRKPHELVFIDDMAHNIAAARALGWPAVLFRGATDCAAALRSAGSQGQRA